jgi:hypothetical protein
VLELAGLLAAELCAAFELRSQVGWRGAVVAGDRLRNQDGRGQGDEASAEPRGGEPGRSAGRASGELLRDREAEPLDRHATAALKRLELVDAAVEHGGELVVMRDRHRAVEAPFAQPAFKFT